MPDKDDRPEGTSGEELKSELKGEPDEAPPPSTDMDVEENHEGAGAKGVGASSALDAVFMNAEAEAEAEAGGAMDEDHDGAGEPAKEGAKEEVKEEDEEAKEVKEEAEGEEDKPQPEGKQPEKPAEPEEFELDDEPDERVRLGQTVQFSTLDCTMDVLHTGDGAVLSSLSQKGFQYLLSGARANTGASAGRYLFEVRVLEIAHSGDCALRVGVSTARSSLFLADNTPDNVCFDSDDGSFYLPAPVGGDQKNLRHVRHGLPNQQSQAFRSRVVGILLNLHPSGPNARTLSLFLDGVRMGPPRELPPRFVDGSPALFPTVTFKNLTIAVNFGRGGAQLRKLPFKCRMFGDIAAADCEYVACAHPDQSERCSVVVPVGIPEQGYFDFVDHFLESRPDYTELSDRKVIEWCQKSDLKAKDRNVVAKDGSTVGGNRARGKGKGKGTVDKPVFSYGIPDIDNKSLRTMLSFIAQMSRRNFLVAEVKANLTRKARDDLLAKFGGMGFSVRCLVAVGQPPAEFKSWVHGKIMAQYEKANAERKAEIARKKEKAELQIKKNSERIRRWAELRAQKEAKAAGKTESSSADGTVAAKEETAGEEQPEKNEKAAEVKAAVEAAVEAAAEPAEEQELPLPDVGPDVWHLPRPSWQGYDVAPQLIRSNCASFSLPGEDEKFDEVEFVWQPRAEAESHMRQWLVEQKAQLVVEELQPSGAFKEKLRTWKVAKQEMLSKQREFQAKEVGEAAVDDCFYKTAVDDCFKAEDIHDVGGTGLPMYANFTPEDWLLLSCRVELHLLLHDIADANVERPAGLPVDMVSACFPKYFAGMKYGPPSLGCANYEEIAELLKDSFKISQMGTTPTKKQGSFLEPVRAKDTEVAEFVKSTEFDRRNRQRRIDAGDESANLRFSVPTIGAAKDDAESSRKGSGGKAAGKHRKGPVSQASQPSSTKGEEPAWKRPQTRSYAQKLKEISQRVKEKENAKRPTYGGNRGSTWEKTKTSSLPPPPLAPPVPHSDDTRWNDRRGDRRSDWSGGRDSTRYTGRDSRDKGGREKGGGKYRESDSSKRVYSGKGRAASTDSKDSAGWRGSRDQYSSSQAKRPRIDDRRDRLPPPRQSSRGPAPPMPSRRDRTTSIGASSSRWGSQQGRR